MNQNHLSVVLFFLLFIGCKEKKEVICSMDNIGQFKHYKNEYENNLKTNYFIFYENGRLFVPPIAFYSDKTEGTWKIKMEKGNIDSLFIQADNELYSGSYKVRFLKNETNSRLFMELKSDSLEIVLYNYFKTKRERDAFINKYDIDINKVSDDYFPQLEQFPDNWKTFD